MDSTFNSQYAGQGQDLISPDIVILTEAPNITQSCIGGSIKGPSRIRPYPLSDFNDLKIQQALIIKDLLFSLLGYEGCYVRYSEKYDASNVDHRIRGPDFKTAKHLDISLKSITKKLIKFGKYYMGLTGFVEYYDNKKYGTVIQNLCFNINEFLVSYQRIILKIENEFQFSSKFNLSVFENILNQELSNRLLHYYEIIIEIHELTLQRQLELTEAKDTSSDFLNDVKFSLEQRGDIMDATMMNSQNFQRCKGGLVLKIVQGRIKNYKGDIVSLEFLTGLFESISENYIQMLNNWLINGEINDQFDEFMIREKKVPANLLDFFNAKSEHYWNELFVVRSDGLIDQFQNLDIQRKILNTGKYLNIFKLCTGIHNFNTLNEVIIPITKVYSQSLELKINEFYMRANKLLLKLLFEGFYFSNLIKDYQSIFLFSNSSHIDSFLDKSFYDLKRNRNTISLSKVKKQFNESFESPSQQSRPISNTITTISISEILLSNQNFSITSSNFYEVAKEIMNVQSFDTENVLKNDVNFKSFFSSAFQKPPQEALSPSDPSNTGNPSTYDQNRSDDYGIASLDLSIDLPFPLNLIINRELSYHYELMFKLQILIKFINKFNNTTWMDITHSAVWKYPRFEPRIKKWILRCRILHKRMRDFLNELQIYLNFDVIDSNYVKLEAVLTKMEAFLKEEQLGSDIDQETLSTNAGLNNYNTFNNNSNNIFSNRLSSVGRAKSIYRANGNNNSSNENLQNSSKKDEKHTVEHLISHLNEFLNTLINDSLITKPDLLNVLKNMFDMIISFNNYLNRLKKVLILCNEDLFSKFSSDYPDKFSDKSMDAESIENRFANLTSSLKVHYDIFGDSLTEFIVTLKAFGEVENKQILLLSESLENCFPES